MIFCLCPNVQYAKEYLPFSSLLPRTFRRPEWTSNLLRRPTCPVALGAPLIGFGADAPFSGIAVSNPSCPAPSLIRHPGMLPSLRLFSPPPHCRPVLQPRLYFQHPLLILLRAKFLLFLFLHFIRLKLIIRIHRYQIYHNSARHQM